jgi:DNA-binding response OmpR family regulator
MTQNQTILLIINDPDRLESLSTGLRQIGYKVVSADDGRMGFRLVRRESPDLVISEMNLPVISGLELCRMIRADRELWSTPLIFLSAKGEESSNLVEILRAGADECLADVSDHEYLAAKIQWLIERKYSENHLVRYYQNLHSRQLQINQIIKGVFDLLTTTEFEHRGSASFDQAEGREFEKSLNKRMDLGMNMVSAVAYLLEKHVEAFEFWARTRRGNNFTLCPESDIEERELNYNCITYDLIDNDLQVN